MARVGKPRKKGQRWEISYYDSDGKRRFETYATKSLAIQAQNKKKTEAQAIKAGLVKKPIAEHTFSELCDQWLKRKTAQKRSPKDDQSIIRRHFRPLLGDRLLSEIHISDLDPYFESNRELAPKTIHNHLTLLISMFNYAVEKLNWLEKRPAFEKPKLLELDYEWLKTTHDIARLLQAAAQERPGVMELYATAV